MSSVRPFSFHLMEFALPVRGDAGLTLARDAAYHGRQLFD
jgi:hypothetical protein